MLELILDAGILRDYADVYAAPEASFIILRHDVEFSPKRALQLARLEASSGVSASYFFQVSGSSYNLFSPENIEIAGEISSLGHRLGLHFNPHAPRMTKAAEDAILFELNAMTERLGLKIDRFSIHRPTADLLEQRIHIDGFINAYSQEFFSYYSPEEEIPDEPPVKYVSDARNQWCYTGRFDFPDEAFFKSYKKVQLLCHPYTWTEQGLCEADNFKALLAERKLEFSLNYRKETC